VATQLAWGGPQMAATGAFARWMGKAAGGQQRMFLESTRSEVARGLFSADDQADDFLRLVERIRQERLAAMNNAGGTLTAAGVAGAQSGRPAAGP